MSSTRNVRRMPQKPPRCISAIVNAQFFNVGTFLNINDNQTHEYWFLRGTLCCNNRPFCPLKMMMTKVTIYVGGNLIIRIIQAALQLFLKKGKFQYQRCSTNVCTVNFRYNLTFVKKWWVYSISRPPQIKSTFVFQTLRVASSFGNWNVEVVVAEMGNLSTYSFDFRIIRW